MRANQRLPETKHDPEPVCKRQAKKCQRQYHENQHLSKHLVKRMVPPSSIWRSREKLSDVAARKQPVRKTIAVGPSHYVFNMVVIVGCLCHFHPANMQTKIGVLSVPESVSPLRISNVSRCVPRHQISLREITRVRLEHE